MVVTIIVYYYAYVLKIYMAEAHEEVPESEVQVW